jgi:hypothetical protein
MDDSIRRLRWDNGVLKFPCGVKVEISEEKVRRLFSLFKVDAKLIDHMIKSNESIPIPKGTAFQIKSHLT